MNTLQIIGRNARLRREALALSQEELAERSGLHRTYVGAIERAERNLTIRVLERLATGLSCSAVDLLTKA